MQLTDAQAAMVVSAVKEIAQGCWFVGGKRQARFSREDLRDRARRILIELGIDWYDAKPERYNHKACIQPALEAISVRKEEKLPCKVGRPSKVRGIDAFAIAGKGAL